MLRRPVRSRALLIGAVSLMIMAVPSLAVAEPPAPSPSTSPGATSSAEPSPTGTGEPEPSTEQSSTEQPSAENPGTSSQPTPESTPEPTPERTPEPSSGPTTAAPTVPSPSTGEPSTSAPAQEPAPERRSAEPELTVTASSSSPIAVRYRQSGGASGPLGAVTIAEQAVSGGRYARYAKGAIYWSSATGAKIVWNDEQAALLEVGGLSRMGFPRTERDCSISGGCAQRFTGGLIMRSSRVGTHAVLGAISHRYLVDRNDDRVLGFPLDREHCGLRDRGCYQEFEHGGIYYTPKLGSRMVALAFYRTWATLTWERGALGYPTGERRCGLREGGCYQTFEQGNLYYTSALGVQPSWGAIFRSWGASSWERGPLGYPTGREVCGQVSSGCYQNFQRGRVLYSPTTGAHRVHGAIRTAYSAEGWHTGRLRYPKTDENCSLSGGGCVQEFTGGAIYYSKAKGAYAVSGAILGTWRRNGAQDGVMKYPVGRQSCSGSTCRQSFENGVISASGGTGRLEIRGIQVSIRRTTASDVRYTYRSGCPVPPSRLRTIEMNYWGYDGRIRRGVLIVRDSLADGVAKAFAEAYGKRWPIARMDNPNLWQGNDPKMMTANLTSGFNCRQVVGNPYAVSPHSYGVAIDTNTVQNPYRDRNGTWWPSNGKGYILGAVLNRPRVHPGVHTTSTPFVQAIEKRGWFWGGRWSPGRDYHHFEYR